MDDLAISGNSIHPEQTEIIMYQTEDGLTKIDVPHGKRNRLADAGADGGTVSTRAQRYHENI